MRITCSRIPVWSLVLHIQERLVEHESDLFKCRICELWCDRTWQSVVARERLVGHESDLFKCRICELRCDRTWQSVVARVRCRISSRVRVPDTGMESGTAYSGAFSGNERFIQVPDM
ncbi:hypothetical protein J6590_080995 [Homalodisca vitripennis]|nr:hypothetical protein J6590_080995 [Homalodisca vitripennis]